MLKRRLIFALLWQNDAFWMSRNFRVQRVGDLDWLERHYNFTVVADSIDELVVQNISRGARNSADFGRQIRALTRNCFVPLTAGGGVRHADDAQRLLDDGADKILVNTPIFDAPEMVAEIARRYGRQCVVASIDYRTTSEGTEVFVDNGTRAAGLDVQAAVARAVECGAGEILLTSMDRDGTGQGYDVGVLRQVAAVAPVPVIAAGGVGTFDHLAAWLEDPLGQAACTANIFNFLGDGLREARGHIVARGSALATWEYGWRG